MQAAISAVALSYGEGPEAGLAMLDGLERDGALARYQPYHAARADMLRRLDRRDDATVAYRIALDLTDNDAEKDFLGRRLAEVVDDQGLGHDLAK